MFTENNRAIIMEALEEYGWLDNRDNAMVLEERKRLANKLLARGDSPGEVADVADLPIDVVMEMANQMLELPAGV